MGQTTEVGVHPDMDEHIITPWGSYQVLNSGPGYRVKQLMVEPGQATSLQIHQYRDERWVVVRGEGVATRGEQRIKLREGSTIFIPFCMPHRIESSQHGQLQVIEVQYGGYLGEDDIVRLEDRYGRVQ